MKKSSRARKSRQPVSAASGLRATRRSVKAGLPPGTMVHVGERKTDRTTIRAMEFGAAGVAEHVATDVDGVLRIRTGGNPVWVNVYGLQDVNLVQGLAQSFGIGALNQEDIVSTGHPPRVEFHDDYVFVVMKTIKFEPAEGFPRLKGCEGIPELDIDQITIVVGNDFVLCFHEEETDRLESLRDRVRSGHGYDLLARPDYLGYAIVDTVVDNSFVVLEQIGDAIESMESEVVDSYDSGMAARIHLYKRQILQLRKAISPLRSVLNKLTTEGHRLVAASTLPYLRDVNDHVVQIVDMIDTFREVLAGVLEVNISRISMRTNEVMKILTIISTIFIPLTFIVGIYGMNFKNMPELGSAWGYPLVWVSFGLVSGGLMLFFRKKKWL